MMRCMKFLKDKKRNLFNVLKESQQKEILFFLQKYLYSDDEYDSSIVQAMEKAGCDPAHIYAYLKTRRLIFQSTLKHATGAQIEEWKDAVDEYYVLKEEGIGQTDFSLDLAALTNDLKNELKTCIYVFGFTLDMHINFIKKYPEKIDDLVKAKIGLQTGTHEYKKHLREN